MVDIMENSNQPPGSNHLIDPFSVASETEFTVTVKTYEAKGLIALAGFKWDRESRIWVGGATAKANFEEMGNPARGRANAYLERLKTSFGDSWRTYWE